MSDTWGWLCAGDPEHAAGILGSLIRQVPYEAGPPEADRHVLVERLSAELAELEQREEAAIDEATAAGVVVRHRPEVVARRERERMLVQDQEDETRVMDEKQAHVDRRYSRAIVK